MRSLRFRGGILRCDRVRSVIVPRAGPTSARDSKLIVAAGKSACNLTTAFYIYALSSWAEGLSSPVTTELPGNNKQRAPCPWTPTSGEKTDVSGGGTSEFGLR